ncbi:LamB/YcsF family protein [Paenibacillus chitinolyticus]|uniref:LamB/YcsF family protein n=1 Tax=Paenibacillus chitinolyticus TaxID=79263 RepID=UPI003866A604
MVSIDLNCDMGESYGAYRFGRDEELLESISSANIACGFHAGDPGVMRRTVALCLEQGVAVGAHPGLPDLAGFGRREMAVGAEEVYELTLYQLGALQAFVQAEGGTLRHVKPHGALYHMAAARGDLADAVARAALRVSGGALVLLGPPGSELLRAGKAHGLRTAAEAFADRTYRPDGTLTPRTEPGALLSDPAQAAAQVLRLVRDGVVTGACGETVPLAAETVCVHGDGPHAAAIARSVRAALDEAGVAVRPPWGA